MPSFSYIPATIAFTPGSIPTIPELFAFQPARITLTPANDIDMGPSTEGTRTETTVKLDRLQRQFPVVDKNGYPTGQFHAFQQEFADTIEAAFALDREQIGENGRILDLIANALGIARNALDTANAVQAATSLQNSYTDPVAVLSATSGGAVTINAHDRVYADGSRVAVSAGSLSGFANGANVTVYYNDPAREGGAVTFIGSTSAVAQVGATHIVGQVTIPAAGEPNAPGYGPAAPGYTVPPEAIGNINYQF